MQTFHSTNQCQKGYQKLPLASLNLLFLLINIVTFIVLFWHGLCNLKQCQIRKGGDRMYLRVWTAAVAGMFLMAWILDKIYC